MKIEREIHRIVAAAPYLCGVLFTLLLTPALAYFLVMAIAWCVHTGFSWLCTNPRTKHFTTLMARSNSPTLGHPKFPQAGPPDYDDSGATAMRAAASLRR